ncbi:hypothetical protein HRR83_003466 [Exophiala dermatitidis]|uniref:Uncharacterized protein n=2 Tax=Exophiala dermatitidis TaxID=5970 RepID=H6BM36_EXODN|nr:uncharacterized protein HMPREF1120_00195 [Exophiala dermatitidis NIH/UT8656]KAJ4514643.1 hypothetical protein HRR75_004007 [Exophiala dermatitidis]EHY51972.1 hypothetical protein HMPREF1120_00195 [Exophiala dermatitidis NIH/UT8656]KAJ4518077.1 hypothetical protein HRR74_004372 [Exophiala dermatitidis]KAJ4520976.1 hypothetical protein HRR73_003317 [Exophiala dermatitidis]KAJ4546007.1 hypothetical protein HRR78_005846 [Exophiala dermatitidis]
MPVTQYSQIKPGLLVSIVLKADQRTGRQVQGTVSQLLTRHNHPRGIKVKLTDGRVGRVQQILPQNQNSNSRQQRIMESNNPWADASSQNTSNAGQPAQGSRQQSYPPQTQFSPYSSSQQHSQPQQQSAAHAPSQGVRRTDTDQLLAQQEDRAAQVEHMQQFEANAPQSEGDRIQAQLQKEFPNIDSSLIAAIYNERPGNLPEVREMLQELNTN